MPNRCPTVGPGEITIWICEYQRTIEPASPAQSLTKRPIISLVVRPLAGPVQHSQGLSSREIACITGNSGLAIRSHLVRAKRMLAGLEVTAQAYFAATRVVRAAIQVSSVWVSYVG